MEEDEKAAAVPSFAEPWRKIYSVYKTLRLEATFSTLWLVLGALREALRHGLCILCLWVEEAECRPSRHHRQSPARLQI